MNAKKFRNKIKLAKKYLPDNLNILFISTFGSYNYNLQNKLSDIDLKLVYIPQLYEIISHEAEVRTIEISSIGNCDLISLPHFIDGLTRYELPYLEIIMSMKYIWINDEYKDLFNKLRELTLKMLIENKYSLLCSIIDTSERIYGIFVNNKLIKYKGKKAYHIPRFEILFNHFMGTDEYNLEVNDKHIYEYKVGVVDQETAKWECSNIISRFKTTKSLLEPTDNTTDKFKLEFKNIVVKELVQNEIKRNDLVNNEVVNSAIIQDEVTNYMELKYKQKQIKLIIIIMSIYNVLMLLIMLKLFWN